MQKFLEEIRKNDELANSINRIISPVANTAAHQLTEAINSPAANTTMHQLTEAINGPAANTAMHKLTEAINGPAANTAMHKLAEAINGPAANTAMHKLAEAINGPAVNTAMHDLAGVINPDANTAIQKLATEMLSDVSTIMERVNKTDIPATGLIEAFEKVLEPESYYSERWGYVNAALSPLEMEGTAHTTHPSPENDTSTAAYSKFRMLLWAIFICCLQSVWYGILMPQFNANYVTPLVDPILSDDSLSKRDKIKRIKKIPQSDSTIVTKNLRFITGNNVRLRSSPSTQSEILDELSFGQVVTVLRKKRNWIKVTYNYEDEILEGWVFTTYTRKFPQQ